MAKIKDISVQIRGVSYKPTDLHDDLNNNSVMLLRANNIENDKINFNDVIYVDKSKVSSSQYLKIGDILICTSSGSKNLVGKSAIVDKEIIAAFGAFCKVIRPKNVYPYYLGHYFTSTKYRNIISELSAGANINNIRNEHIDLLEIPLPPLEIQKQIADNLDKVTRTIDICNSIIEKFDLLVKSRFVEMFGDTEVNSNNHPVHKLSDLCTVSSSKRIYQEEQSSSGVPFLRISNLVELIDNGRFGSDLFIPEEKYNELFTNGLVPKADDILVTSRGTLGKCYIIQEHDKFYFQDGMISWLYDIDKSITPLYLTLLFDTRDIKRQIDNLQSGSTVAYLSIAMLKKLNIVVPPLALQEQFADFVKQVDKSKLAVKQALEKAEILKNALMQEYFG